jgi:hypothetical protein
MTASSEEASQVLQEVLIEPPRAPNLAPQRERSPELDPDLGPRLRAPERMEHHAQDAVDPEPGVPEAGVGVGRGFFGPHGRYPLFSSRRSARWFSLHAMALGWLGPSAVSKIAKARRYSGSASTYRACDL